MLNQDKLIPLRDVVNLPFLPRRRRGSKLSFSTVWRWVLRGCEGRKLKAVKVGGTLCTSRKWLQEFFCTPLDDDEPSPAVSIRSFGRSAGQRSRAVKRVKRELENMGI